MSGTATENSGVDLSNWISGVRFFSTSDDKHMIIDSDLKNYPEGSTTFIRRKTVIFNCNADGVVYDMVPDHIFPPGTTAEEALSELGYTVI